MPEGRPPEFGPRPAHETAAKLPFLRDGITTQAEVLARLGSPVHRMSKDRTWFYPFVLTRDGGLLQSGFGRLNVVGVPEMREDRRYWYELVLTFDASERLVRHTLVEKPDMQSQ